MTQTAENLSFDQQTDYRGKLVSAMVAFNQRDFLHTVEICEEILEAWPDGAECHLILGVVAYAMGNQGRAIKLIERAHGLDPECRDYADALANLCTRVGRLSDGLYYAKLAGTLTPHPSGGTMVPRDLSNYFMALHTASPSSHYLSAMREYEAWHFKQAVEECRAELEINRNHVECWRLLGRALHRTGNYEDAVSAFHAVIHMQPGHAMDHVELGDSLYGLGHHADALACHRLARKMDPNSGAVHLGTAGGLIHQPDALWPLYRKWAAAWSRKNVISRKKKPSRKFEAVPGRKIRVGYLVDRLFHCPEVRFLEPLFKYRNKHVFEIYCYRSFGKKDVVTTRFENYVDRWRDIEGVDDVSLGYIMEGDEIDIVIDLSKEATNARPEVMGKRPASVVVSWLGCPETAGAPGADLVLSDKVTADIDAKTCLKEEETVTLESGLIGLDPLTFFPDVEALPARSNNHVTFGGVCDLARMTPEVASVWSSILLAVPGSRLVLGYVENISPKVAESAIEIFGHFGVADRIHFQQAEPANDEASSSAEVNNPGEPNKAFLGLIDVFLDTFPVTGGLEICEALWMGVPAVTLAGKRRSGLMGTSILASAGKEKWAAHSTDDYIETAAALGTDLDRLESIRRSLREEVEKSVLFNPQAFVRSIENAYMAVLRK